VSVVIPCFNRAAMVAEAIESALAQGDECEVIVIDDGSTDGSWDVISSYAQVRAERTANRGVAAARNRGIALARGAFIRFLDSDDLLAPDSTQAMLAAAESLAANEILVGTAVVQSSRRHKPTYGYADNCGRLSGPALLRRTMPCVLPLFPKSALAETPMFDEAITIGEDYVLAARLHASGWTFVQSPIETYIVRDHDEPRLTRGYGREGFKAQLKTFNAALQALGEPTAAERIAIAQAVWTVARDASRAGCKREAKALFGFATQLGGRSARVGSRPVRLLYDLLPPYLAEQLVQLAKASRARAHAAP
jgi:glycosyltransferase involved in cell wall biosynthesis